MLPGQVRTTVIALTVILMTSAVNAQSDSCVEAGALSRMARARSVSALRFAHREISPGYRGHLIFAFRQFELSPNDPHAADELLSLIPTSDEQERAIHSLSGFICQGESVSDVRVLSALENRLARDLSMAVLVVPSQMNAHVVYAAEAVQDPNSDYAVQMQHVCRTRHASFLEAVNELGSGTSEKGNFATASTDWFRKHILDPSRCRALAIPEAK